jgi:hypothetical protein
LFSIHTLLNLVSHNNFRLDDTMLCCLIFFLLFLSNKRNQEINDMILFHLVKISFFKDTCTYRFINIEKLLFIGSVMHMLRIRNTQTSFCCLIYICTQWWMSIWIILSALKTVVILWSRKDQPIQYPPNS